MMDAPLAHLNTDSLYHAAMDGDLQLVQQHIDAGVRLDKVGPGQMLGTALDVSVCSGHLAVSRALLAAGAAHGLSIQRLWTLSDDEQPEAQGRRWMEQTRFVVEEVGVPGGQLENMMMAAVRAGSVPIVEYLVRRGGVDLNACTYNGDRPLCMAAHVGDLGVVDALLRLGADAKATDSTGRTPAQIADAQGRHLVAVRLAEAAGIDQSLSPETRRLAADLRELAEYRAMPAALQEAIVGLAGGATRLRGHV